MFLSWIDFFSFCCGVMLAVYGGLRIGDGAIRGQEPLPQGALQCFGVTAGLGGFFWLEKSFGLK